MQAMPSSNTSPCWGPQSCEVDRKMKKDRLCFEELSQWSHSLDRLLASKYGLKIFQAFLKSEFSDENIEFWLVCEDYKRIKSSYRMSSRAKKIFKRYIQAEAPKEINIDQKTREMIRQNITESASTCFDDAQKIVFGLMEKDSYPRFLRSNVYRTLLDSSWPHQRTENWTYILKASEYWKWKCLGLWKKGSVCGANGSWLPSLWWLIMKYLKQKWIGLQNLVFFSFFVRVTKSLFFLVAETINV